MNWDAITAKHAAILGKTGSGKTYAAKGIVEWLLRHDRQVCIIDPTSAWWGLRLAADGKGKGHDVIIIGGDHGDIPLSERSGSAVARLVTEQGASVVIDTGGMTVGEYTRWFIDFAGTLYTTIRGPLHLVIDEAHYFMPQGKVPDPMTGKMLHAGNRLISGGRSRGIRAIMITQRPAKFHKDSLTCADTLIAMQLIAPQDRQAVKDWIDGCGNPDDGRTVLDSLASLRHEGWVWYPEGNIIERHKFPSIKTYDSSAAPSHGASRAVKLGDIDLSAVKAAMAEAVKEAEANDPALLRRRIAELERAATKQAVPVATVDRAAIERAVSVAVRAERQRWEARDRACNRAFTTVIGRLSKIGELAASNGIVWPDPIQAFEAPKAVVVRSNCEPRRVESSRPIGGDGTLGRAELAILRAAKQIGERATRARLSVLSGYSITSSSFVNALGTLRSRGYIDGRGDDNTITDAGRVAAGEVDPLPSGEELVQWWASRLGKAERAILQSIADGASAREAIAAASGYSLTSSSFVNALGKLRTLELVEGRGDDNRLGSALRD